MSIKRLLQLSSFALTALALQSFDTWGHQRIQLEDVQIHFRYSDGGKTPLLLVHGAPQHSHTWTHIGPILAEKFTVIAPDNRGMGSSSLSTTDNYTAAAGGKDLRAVLNFLNITKVPVLAHDKGPDLVDRLILAEYPLPGFGYTTNVTSPSLYENWQLAFFAVPDAAQYFMQGQEKEMLSWYFWHSSYSGNDVISNELLEIYTRSISKPGFLRSMFQYFAAAFADATYFTTKVNAGGKLQMPVLVMGGEALFSPAEVQQAAFEPVAEHLSTAVVPKSGHWIGDENPAWVAQTAMDFFNSTNLPPVDVAWLRDSVSLSGGFGMSVILTPGINGTA